MTIEEMVRENVDAYNAGDWDRYAAAFADEVVAKEFATGRELRGLDALMDSARGWRNAFPDLAGEVINAFSSGDRGVVEVRWRGTHSGPLTTPDGQTIPPTNRAVEVMTCYVSTLRDDKVVERHDYFDLATIMRQIGLMPEGA